MQSHLLARMISLPQLCATSSVQTDPSGLSHILTSLQHSHLIPAIASVGAKVSQIRQEPKNHPLNSIHPMPVHCVSFSAQQHLFGIWTQGEPLKVLCEDEVRTPACGTHTETQHPHRDMVPTPGCSARRGMQCPPHALTLSLPASCHTLAPLPALAAAVSPRVCVYHHLVKLRFPRSPDLFVLGSQWLAAIP